MKIHLFILSFLSFLCLVSSPSFPWHLSPFPISPFAHSPTQPFLSFTEMAHLSDVFPGVKTAPGGNFDDFLQFRTAQYNPEMDSHRTPRRIGFGIYIYVCVCV